MTRRVLFLCTGNSCRSQMAEAITNTLYGRDWKAYSAGTKPVGYVHPLVVKVLEEIGIHHQGESKTVDAVAAIPFDRVITVCDSAAEECPLWLGTGMRYHHSFPDPAKASGSEENILNEFRKVRDMIVEEIPRMLE